MLTHVRICFVVLLGILLGGSTGCRQQPLKTGPRRPPNIVILQADDLGWGDVGFHGNRRVKTPNLDALAAESTRFEAFYVTPVCAPTRAALLTGRHHLLTGVSHVHGGGDFIRREERLMGESLREAGYRTGMWGKWHSGTTDGYWPWQRGFDEAYVARLYQHRNSQGLVNGEPLSTQKWADELVVDLALAFMEKVGDRPFLAYLSFLTCHAPLDAPDAFIQPYKEAGLSNGLATLYGMISSFDHQIGRLLGQMHARGLLDNTVVMFMSDNGPASVAPVLSDSDQALRRTGPFRGLKGDIWENGVRSPLLIRAPHLFAARNIATPIDVTDIFPTALELAGRAPNTKGPALSGRSLVPLLKAGHGEPRDIVLYGHSAWPANGRPWSAGGVDDEYAPVPPGTAADALPFASQSLAIRRGRHKLIVNPNRYPMDDASAADDGLVLFDVVADPAEAVDLSTSAADLAADLRGALRSWHTAHFRAPGAFARPTFVIGGEGTGSNVVRGFAPVRVSPGLHNAAHWLEGWSAPGRWAEYAIEVRRPGSYQVAVLTEGAGGEARFRVVVSNAPTEEIGGVSVPARAKGEREAWSDQPITLSAGPASLRLVLDVAASPLAVAQISFRPLDLPPER